MNEQPYSICRPECPSWHLDFPCTCGSNYVAELQMSVLALQTQLERVELETIERCAKLIESNVIRICEHEFGYNTKKGIAASIRALPSAKTETE